MRNTFWLNELYVVLFFCIIGSLKLLAQSLPYETVTANGQLYYKYNVKPGEGVYAVSRTFSVSVAEILRHNPDANKGLKNGQQLLIPVPANNTGVTNTPITPTPSSSSAHQDPVDQNTTFKHTVVRGETVYSLSKMYNTTVEEIYRYNPGTREGITEGQVLTIPQRRIISEEKEENYRYHTILPKETLFSVSRTYSLTPENILQANPGLSVETFQIGKTIRIPFFESNERIIPYELQTTEIWHTVKRGETLYSLSRHYNVPVAEIQRANPALSEGLRINMEVIIPVKKSEVDGDTRAMEQQANRLLTQGMQSPRADVIKIGLLLPFLDKRDNQQHLRLQEYYEGLLIAVEKMKNEGTNIDLYVFDTGTENDTRKLESLLGTLEMQSLHLIIGGISDKKIKILSDFSKAYNIKYVIPFSSRNNEVLNNGYIFQVNPQQSFNHTKASNVFVETFRNANVVFVNTGQNDKTDFISQLQDDLRKSNVRYQTINLTGSLETTIPSLLNTGRENVIVPTSGDSHSLRQIMTALDSVNQTNPSSYVTRLFGYPEWQTYSEEIQREYQKFGTYFYSAFYVDENASDARAFMEDFRKWYHRGLINTYPKYGMLGYDTGLYFITALRRYGVNFEQHIDQIRIRPVQFAFNFERVNNWGGFINTGLYLVHYNTNGTIVKTDKSR